jgi:hypothetical protein
MKVLGSEESINVKEQLKRLYSSPGSRGPGSVPKAILSPRRISNAGCLKSFEVTSTASKLQHCNSILLQCSNEWGIEDTINLTIVPPERMWTPKNLHNKRPIVSLMHRTEIILTCHLTWRSPIYHRNVHPTLVCSIRRALHVLQIRAPMTAYERSVGC